jgi:hypothetical protein
MPQDQCSVRPFSSSPRPIPDAARIAQIAKMRPRKSKVRCEVLKRCRAAPTGRRNATSFAKDRHLPLEWRGSLRRCRARGRTRRCVEACERPMTDIAMTRSDATDREQEEVIGSSSGRSL